MHVCNTTRADIAASLLGEIRWESDTMGYCRCPGIARHTTKRATRECRVTLDKVPTIFCMHQSCAWEVEESNRELRSRIGKAEAQDSMNGSNLATRAQERHEWERLASLREKREQQARDERALAAKALPNILARYAWNEADAWEASTIRIDCKPRHDGRTLLESLYKPSDVLWTGETYDSGKPEHASRFRTVEEWLKSGGLRQPFICPATFQAGSFSRSESNIATRPYVVLEGDATDPECARKAEAGEPLTDEDKANNRAACLAVLNWLRLETPLELRAIVDSGSKSMHGWFSMPSPEWMSAFRLVLSSLGFDPATLKPAQPVRLPGVKREARWQRLVYLNPG